MHSGPDRATASKLASTAVMGSVVELIEDSQLGFVLVLALYVHRICQEGAGITLTT